MTATVTRLLSQKCLLGVLFAVSTVASPGMSTADPASTSASAPTRAVPEVSLLVRAEPPAAAKAADRPSTDRRLGAVRRFWSRDHHLYASRWYAGRHRKMVPFGCTRAPYYAPSPRCRDNRGFHHGLDIAMPCGTKLYAGLRSTVVHPHSAGELGPAYGPYAFRLRSHRLHVDVVIGHVLQVYVDPGDHVARGTLMARASDQGAPDGCHLHFEVRPEAGSYDSAVSPHDYLHLRRRR
ncbi:MAG: M23 family metallopeptidase [Nocardioidaceae bacterium]